MTCVKIALQDERKYDIKFYHESSDVLRGNHVVNAPGQETPGNHWL
jgi:hypothetical protein